MENTDLKLTNVRISYPELFKAKSNPNYPESVAKYSATFILDKVAHKEEIKQIDFIIDELCKENKSKREKIADKFMCFLDGDETNKEELQGKMYLKSSNKNRPKVVDKKRNPITAEDEIIYPGCFVYAHVSFWGYDGGVSCNLDGVQFSKDGERFGGSGKTLEFDDLEEDFGF